MKHLLLPSVILLFAGVSLAQIPGMVPNERTWTTNGTCKGLEYASGTIYLRGYFTRVGPYTGSGVPFMAATGQPAAVYPKVDGTVLCCLPDGYGGWYIGGYFQHVGYTPRDRLAHILHDGRLDEAWNPGADYTVYALLKTGTRLYIGGSFSTVGGQTRNRLAAVDAATGALDPWNPDASGGVYALAASGGTIYAGGYFTTIGGQARYHLAAMNAANGALSSFNPGRDIVQGPGSSVHTLLISGPTLYAGGQFTINGDQPRKRLAAFDTTSGTVTAWNPIIVGDNVRALATSGTMVYVGGTFTQVNGQSRNNLAALDVTSGTLGAWNPSPDGDINALTIAGSTIYVGGSFTHVGGQARDYAAALDLVSGAAGPWQPEPGHDVCTLAAAGSKVYAGGNFTLCGGVERNGLAALDQATGQPTPWDPNPNGGVSALVRHGSRVYVGGYFTSIGGANRNHLAALDAVTGNATSWNPNPDDVVSILAVKAPVIYVGGWFSKIGGGKTRNRLAQLNLTTGAATAWDAHIEYFDIYVPGNIDAMAISDSQVYVGGDFLWVGGVYRNYLAALDPVTGTASPWNPKPYVDPAHFPPNTTPFMTIDSMALSGSTLYVCGSFEKIGGQPIGGFAALDTVTSYALPLNFNPPTYGNRIYPITSQTMYLQGGSRHFDDRKVREIAAVDLATGSVLPWALNQSVQSANDVVSLVPTSNALYVGGNFKTLIDGRSYFAQYDLYANPGRLAASPASLEFRKGSGFEVDVERGGAPTTRTLTLTNTGEGPVMLTSLPSIAGRCAADYAIDSISPSPYAPIASGSSLNITIRFAPTSTQRTMGLDAYLLVTTDNPITPTFNVPLLGDAVPVNLSGFSIK